MKGTTNNSEIDRKIFINKYPFIYELTSKYILDLTDEEFFGSLDYIKTNLKQNHLNNYFIPDFRKTELEVDQLINFNIEDVPYVMNYILERNNQDINESLNFLRKLKNKLEDYNNEYSKILI